MILSFWLIPICLLIGGLIGFAGGVLGIGGGLIAIPLLGLALGFDQQAAQGTALIMVLPAVLLTLRKYHQRAPLDFKSAAVGAMGSVFFTWLGAQFAIGLDPWLLRKIYAGFVCVIAVFYFQQSLSKKAKQKKEYAAVSDVALHWYALIGVCAGFAGGVFGVGGSVLAVPILTSLFGLRQTSAQAVALSMIVPGTIVALATYAYHGQAHGMVGIPLAIGSLLCVPYGVRLAYQLPEARLKLIFACMLLIIMSMLLLKGS